MRTRLIMLGLAAALTCVGAAPQASLAASAPGVFHVFYVSGTSSINSTCGYKHSSEVDPSGQIPKPTQLPPLCAGNSLPVGQGGAGPNCNLVWNTGGAATSACAGVLTATTGNVGNACVGDTDPTGTTCKLTAQTWFYGFCGQTFGGDPGTGLFHFNGQDWNITRMGFPEGQSDTWEFNGVLQRGTQHLFLRMYLTAAPDKPGEQAGCGAFVTGVPATSVVFTGTLIVTDTQLPKTYNSLSPTDKGWYYCDGHEGPTYFNC